MIESLSSLECRAEEMRMLSARGVVERGWLLTRLF